MSVYIPNMNQCPIVFLKDVFSGKKIEIIIASSIGIKVTKYQANIDSSV